MIHKFKLSGFNILLDVNSGGVHIVDDLTYDLLDNVEPPFADECPEEVVNKLSKLYDAEEIKECYGEIVELYNDGILFSEDDYLLTEILFNPFTGGQVENIRKELKDLLALIEKKDTASLQEYLKKLRKNIE